MHHRRLDVGDIDGSDLRKRHIRKKHQKSKTWNEYHSLPEV